MSSNQTHPLQDSAKESNNNITSECFVYKTNVEPTGIFH